MQCNCVRDFSKCSFLLHSFSCFSCGQTVSLLIRSYFLFQHQSTCPLQMRNFMEFLYFKEACQGREAKQKLKHRGSRPTPHIRRHYGNSSSLNILGSRCICNSLHKHCILHLEQINIIIHKILFKSVLFT